jgi:spermidine synthase
VSPAAHRRAGRVQVRDSARGRELRIDGTFASYYTPGEIVTGSVWDALAAPVLLLPPARRGSILLLGLGGGSVARVVRALAPRARIVGVEIDAEVVRMARRWFDLDALGIEVVRDDAESFLVRNRRRFDAIFDDIFVGSGRRVRKPDWLPRPGLSQMVRRLRPAGILASNAIDEAPEVTRALFELLPGVLAIEVDDYDNRILVGGPGAIRARHLRRAVAANPILQDSVRQFRFRTLRRSARVRSLRTPSRNPRR